MEYEKICLYCGKPFKTTSKQRNCCCSECSHKYGFLVMKQRNKHKRRIYDLNDDFLDILDSKQCWFLGIMASDGYINKTNSTIGISQSGDKGLNMIEYIKELINFQGKIYSSPTKGKISYKISFNSEKMLQRLKDLNIIPNKTKTYKIPDIILNDEEKLRKFLIGYIDGDGSIGVYHNMLVISFVCNRYVYEQLRNIKLFKNSLVTEKKEDLFEFRLNGIKAINFCDYLYNNIDTYKSYKYNNYIEYKKDMFTISPKLKYVFLREKIFQALNENPNMECMKYAEENNLNYKYVYSVRQQWRDSIDKNK